MILEEETHKRFGYFPRDLTQYSHKRIIVVCDDCGKIREISKSKYRALCVNCSRKGERSGRWKGGKVKRICQECGKEFEVHRSQVKKGRGKYCSKVCQGVARSKLIGSCNPCWKGGDKECVCLVCGKVFYVIPARIKNGGGMFCSIKCKGIARSEIYVGASSPNWHGGPIKRICSECGKVFYAPLNRIKKGNGEYCSKACVNTARSRIYVGENSPAWQGGISFEPYCYKFNEQFKQYIRAKFGNICFLCGKTEEENRRKLSVHHVNYNKACGCADTEEEQKADNASCQFVPLCISCNTRVNFNRDKWEKYFKNKLKNKLNGWYI